MWTQVVNGLSIEDGWIKKSDGGGGGGEGVLLRTLKICPGRPPFLGSLGRAVWNMHSSKSRTSVFEATTQ